MLCVVWHKARNMGYLVRLLLTSNNIWYLVSNHVKRLKRWNYEVHTISFKTFLYRHLKLSYTLENSLCYCYTSYEMTDQFLWFKVKMNSYSSNWNTKHDCQRWWISKMKSDTLEERYAIKFCIKIGKNDATETYGMLHAAFEPSCMNRASVFEWHKRFTEPRECVREDERCGRSKKVNTPQLIGQRVRVRVTMLRF